MVIFISILTSRGGVIFITKENAWSYPYSRISKYILYMKCYARINNDSFFSQIFHKMYMDFLYECFIHFVTTQQLSRW